MKLKNLFENWNYYLEEKNLNPEDYPEGYDPETGKPQEEEPNPEDIPDVGPNPEEEAAAKEPAPQGLVSQILSVHQKVFNHFKDPKKLEKLIQPLLVGKVIQKISRRGSMSENVILEAPIDPANFTMNSDRAVQIAAASMETGLPMHVIMAIYAKESGGEVTPRERCVLEGYVFHTLTKGAHAGTVPHVAGYGWKSETEPVIKRKRFGWHYLDLIATLKKYGRITTAQGENYRRIMSIPAKPGSDFAKRKKLYASLLKKGYKIDTVSKFYRYRNLPDGLAHINEFFKADLVKAVLSCSWGTAQIMGFHLLSKRKHASMDDPQSLKEAKHLCKRYGLILGKNNEIIDIQEKLPGIEKESAADFVSWNKNNKRTRDRFLSTGDLLRYGHSYNGSKKYALKLAKSFEKMVKDYPPTALANLLSNYGEKEIT